MPDAQINIKANDQATPTFKKVQDAFKQMEQLTTKFNRQGPFSSKDVGKATDVLKNFHKEYQIGLKTLKEYEKEFSLIEKRISEAVKKQKEFTKGSFGWREQEYNIRQLGKVQQKVEDRRDQLMGILSKGPEEATALQRQADMSSGIGIGTIAKAAVITAIGYEIGKGIKAGFEQTKTAQETSISIAANMRGNNSREFISALNTPGSDIFGRGIFYGLKPEDKIRAAAALTSVGGQINTEDVMQQLGAEKLGVGQEVLGLRSQQVRAGKTFNSADTAAVLSDAVRSGLEDARRGEFIDSVKALSQTFQNQGVLTNASDISNLMAIMGTATAKNGQPSPFFSGAIGESNLEAINQGIVSTPQNPAKLMFMMRALRFGKRGGPQNLQQLNRLMLRAGKNPALISQIVGEAQREYGGMAPEVLSGSPFFQGIFPGMNIGAADELVSANSVTRGNKLSMMQAAIRGLQPQKGTSIKQLSSFENIMGMLEGKGGTGVESAIVNQARTSLAVSTFTGAVEGISLTTTSLAKSLALLTVSIDRTTGSINKLSGIANNGINH